MAGEPPDSAIPAQRRRALLVCFRCHGKKIKCDLVKAATQSCSNCAQARVPCRVRPSKRGLGKRQSQFDQQTVPRFLPAESATAGTAVSSEAASITVGTDQAHGPQRSPSSPHDLADPLILAPPPPPPPPPQTSFGITTGFEPSQSRAVVSSERRLAGVDYHPPIPSPDSSHARSTPSSRSLGSQQLSVQTSCFGDTGYMTIFSRDNIVDQDKVQQGQLLSGVETISPALQEGFIESYLEYCYVWCPVLDRDFFHGHGGADESPLLQHTLALCGTRINPPLIQYRDSMVYYNRAKELFYNNYEGNALVRLASIMLFFWWSTGAPNQLNMDNAWWWTGIAIRVAQECGLNREPQPRQLAQPWETVGLRRRIWWTLFARDRILSVSQGRPTIIDLDYCDVRMVTPEDFPDPSDPKVHIFINWVELLGISGRISKQLNKKIEDCTNTASFSRELTSWVQSLPTSLSLSIRTGRTTSFDRDVHRLHVTYLTNVTLLHLSKSSQLLLPKASKAAIVAASCVARLFEDFLTRGNVRFLSGEAGWEIAVALLALLHARRIEDLRAHADADIRTLRTALRQMALMWPSSRMFAAAIDKLSAVDDQPAAAPAPSASAGRHTQQQNDNSNTNANDNAVETGSDGARHGVEDAEMLGVIDDDDGDDDENADWMDAFPFVTEQTSPLIGAVLARNLAVPLPELDWPLDISGNLQEFLALPSDYSFGMLSL